MDETQPRKSSKWRPIARRWAALILLVGFPAWVYTSMLRMELVTIELDAEVRARNAAYILDAKKAIKAKLSDENGWIRATDRLMAGLGPVGSDPRVTGQAMAALYPERVSPEFWEYHVNPASGNVSLVDADRYYWFKSTYTTSFFRPNEPNSLKTYQELIVANFNALVASGRFFAVMDQPIHELTRGLQSATLSTITGETLGSGGVYGAMPPANLAPLPRDSYETLNLDLIASAKPVDWANFRLRLLASATAHASARLRTMGSPAQRLSRNEARFDGSGEWKILGATAADLLTRGRRMRRETHMQELILERLDSIDSMRDLDEILDTAKPELPWRPSAFFDRLEAIQRDRLIAAAVALYRGDGAPEAPGPGSHFHDIFLERPIQIARGATVRGWLRVTLTAADDPRLRERYGIQPVVQSFVIEADDPILATIPVWRK